MSKITLSIIITFLACFIFAISCSTKDTSSPSNSPTSKANTSSKVENSSSANTNISSNTEDEVTNDAVENYIRMAMKTRDGFHTVNATIFRPNDPRLQYEHKERDTPVPSSGQVFGKITHLTSATLLCKGPEPTKETDQIEARMLMDESLVGTGFWKDLDSSCKTLVFMDSPSSTMPQVRKKYGEPAMTEKLPKAQLNYYGRMILIEIENGKVYSVIRRVIKGTT